jgi:hypothetical protein
VHLADLMSADLPAAIHQMDGGPVVVAERPPVPVVAVEEVWEIEAERACVLGDGVPPAFEIELGGVDPDGRQAPVRVAFEDLPDPGSGAGAVDSAERPDEQQGHPPAELRPAGR